MLQVDAFTVAVKSTLMSVASTEDDKNNPVSIANLCSVILIM
jgi:hypothetical protein